MKQLYIFRKMPIIAILLLFICACNSNLGSKGNENFAKVLIHPNVKDINESMMLRLDPFRKNSLRIGDTIYLEAVNQSSRKIYFPTNLNIQIFRFEATSQKWIEIKNSVNYYGKGGETVPKGHEGLQSAPVVIRPVIENNQDEEIRVAVIGFFVENGSAKDEAVSAYIDLKLKP